MTPGGSEEIHSSAKASPKDEARRPLRSVPAIVPLCILLFLGCFGLYVANGRTRPFSRAGDTVPSRLLPFSILRFGTVTLDPFRESFAKAGGYRWYAQIRRDHLVSFYPLGAALVALPIYAPVMAALAMDGKTTADDLFQASQWAEKLAASAIAAAAVVAVFLVLVRRVSRRRAGAVAAALGTCTLLWPVASEVLWQHGPATLVLGLGLLALDRRQTPRSALAAGLLFALMWAVRPMTLPFGAAAALLVASRQPGAKRIEPRLALSFAVGFSLLAVWILAYNRHYFGSFLGGYAVARFAPHWWQGPVGLLLSPNRGMLVFMPVTLVGFAGAFVALRRWRADRVLAVMLGAAATYFLIHAWSYQWAGGWSYGPRYVIEVLPVLAMSASLVDVKPLAWPFVALALAASLLMQALGAFAYPASNWHGRMGEDIEAHAWDWQHVMVWEDWQAWRRHPPRPGP